MTNLPFLQASDAFIIDDRRIELLRNI